MHDYDCIICGDHCYVDDDSTTIDALVHGRIRHYVACPGFCTNLVTGYLVNTHPDKLGLRRKRAASR